MGVSNASGGVLYRNTYEEYGARGGGDAGRFSFTGQIAIPELGLLHYKARAYNTAIGRFMQTDPVGYADQMNLYAYVGNDPLNGIDPTGMECWFCIGGERVHNADGTVTIRSNEFLRVLVPGQVQWDAARTDFANGNVAEAAGHVALMGAEQVATVATLGAGQAAVGGRAAAGAAERAVAAKGANDVAASAPVGRRGSPMDVPRGTNSPGVVNGQQYTGHAFDQMQGRGITPSAVENTIRTGTSSAGRDGATVYTTNELKVVVNPNGSVKTVVPQ